MAIDLRSDTVTIPTVEMLSSMIAVDVGDDGRTMLDGRGEDPTVRRLEDKAAEITGKQSAIFVPSGTFGNTLGALTLSQEFNPIWVKERAHVLREKALFSDVLFARKHRIYGDLANVPSTPPGKNSLLMVENTVSSDSGRPLDASELHQLDRLKQAGWLIHMDGARLFNAAVATATRVQDIVSSCDTVMFCLSKGLGAPIGSVLCGDDVVIGRARILRKRLGGAMRQAGYVAAAGLAALEKPNIERLTEDHQTARELHKMIASTDGVTARCGTNIVSVRLDSPVAESVVSELDERGYGVRALSANEIRIVTHRGITCGQARLAGQAIADCIVASAK